MNWCLENKLYPSTWKSVPAAYRELLQAVGVNSCSAINVLGTYGEDAQ